MNDPSDADDLRRPILGHVSPESIFAELEILQRWRISVDAKLKDSADFQISVNTKLDALLDEKKARVAVFKFLGFVTGRMAILTAALWAVFVFFYVNFVKK